LTDSARDRILAGSMPRLFVALFPTLRSALRTRRDLLLENLGDAPEVLATKGFVLLLGLAYNDIKALYWVDDQLRKGAAP